MTDTYITLLSSLLVHCTDYEPVNIIFQFPAGFVKRVYSDKLSLKWYWRGPRTPGRVERGSLYVTLHCHNHNDSCSKMGGDESHCYVSLIVRDKVTRHRPQLLKREDSRSGIEPRSCLQALTQAWPSGI